MADEVEYELERPFVTVTSKGGPHDDESYEAGFQMGQLDVILGVPFIQVHTMTIFKKSLKQADLIAMHYGFSMKIEDDEDEFVTVTFVQICTCEDHIDEAP